MSTVPGINNGNTGTSTTNASQSSKKVLGQDDFLKMLIAQLKNQDPLNPLDGKDFAAQLAQFSSLDQLTQINTQLSALASSLASANNSQAVSLIGDEVVANGSSVTVSGTSTTLAYNLSQNVQQGTIEIYDAQGNLVKTLAFGQQQAGNNIMKWNTSNVTPGTYTFTVSAVDSKGNAVSANTMMTGPVTGVTFKNSVPYLSVNGQDVALSDVVYIAKPGN
ncbi:MAG TPA: flagellar hook capping FlgD N-terminal domain-containing protein [Syntrophales bacterium]|nr:flagellar hook capping FlgD N-terminal domain-containing protein [Syntrophales bacterium]